MNIINKCANKSCWEQREYKRELCKYCQRILDNLNNKKYNQGKQLKLVVENTTKRKFIKRGCDI